MESPDFLPSALISRVKMGSWGKCLKFRRFNGEANEFNPIHLKIGKIHNSFDNNRLAHYTVKLPISE